MLAARGIGEKMHQMSHLHFTTLVVTALVSLSSQMAESAPRDGQLKLEGKTEKQTIEVESSRPAADLSTLTVTPAPAESSNSDWQAEGFFFRHPFAITSYLGPHYNSEVYQEEGRLQPLFGTSLRTYETEGGFDLVANSQARLHVSHFWQLSRGRHRPFAKLGGAIQLRGNQGITSLFMLDNYQIRAAIGLEVSKVGAMSLRTEWIVAASVQEQEGIALLGLSWAWSK